MPRKAFLADVALTSEKAIDSILDVKRGDDDGDVNFVFVPASGTPIAIGLLALGRSSIPICTSSLIGT
jgi:ubiquitin-conjugating enzyme E2 Q